MKTNLDKLFKNDDSLELNGVWLHISEEVGFLVKRFGGTNANAVKAAMVKHYKPVARLVENGLLDADKEFEIQLKMFVASCMVDWKGVEIDGKLTPFNREVAIEFLKNLPELARTLMDYAGDAKNYREEYTQEDKEALGNS